MKVIKLLRKNNLVGLFPEGQRSRDGKVGDGKLGVAIMALKAGVPVIPLAIKGTFEAFPRKTKFIKPIKITIDNETNSISIGNGSDHHFGKGEGYSFFSKDEILVAAYNHNQIYFWVEWIVAGLTAFYMFRLYFGIFWGKEKKYEHTPHEAPFSMTFPLIFLAIASAIVGFIPFSNFVTSDGLPFDIQMHWEIALPSIGIAIFGIIVAFVFYKKESDLPNRAVASFGSFYKYALNKFYFDELYLFVARKVIFKRFSSPIAWFDRHIIDATMDGVATITNYIALKIKGLQSGQLQQYASVFVSGVLLLIVIFIYLISV